MRLLERSQNDVLTEDVLSFIGNYYEKNAKPPSINLLVKKVEGVNRRKFYDLFPGGIAEPCEKLGIPAPSERIETTKKARQGKRDTPRVDDESVNALMRLFGESRPREAWKKAVKTVADFSSYSMLYGLKDASELVRYFENQHDLDMERIIKLSLDNDTLRGYYYENDSELMEVMGVPAPIKKRFLSFMCRSNAKGNMFLSWLYGTFIQLCKNEELRREEESGYF